MNTKYSFLPLLLAMASLVAVAQTSVQNFGTSSAVLTSQTASTTTIPNPTSGTTYARAGAVAPNAPIKILNAANSLGSDSYLRATASSSTSVCKVTPWLGYTSSTEFYTSFKTMFADSSGGTKDSSGVWSFYQGAGAMYSNNNDLTNNQVFCGLRFTLSVGGNISLSYMAGTSWISTGLVTSTFASSTIYKIEIFGNNKTSGTISYTHNGVAQSVAVQKFDLYINGVKVGDDLAEGALPANTSINAGTFIGISSTNNVANIFLDDVITYNAIPATITNVPYSPLITSIIPQNNRLKINFTAGGTGGSAITNYKYSLDSGITWLAFSPAVTASPFTITGLTNGTAYNIRIKAVNANGEGDISNVMNAIPNCVTTNSTTNVSLCYNQLPYTWNGTAYLAYGTYTQTLVNVALCDSIATLNLTSTNNNTSVSIASSSATANLCSTTSITFTATPTNGGASPTYTWKKNGTTVGTNSVTYTSATWANNDTVQCLMTSNANCPLPATTWSNIIYINLENQITNTWQQKADFGFTQANGPMFRKGAVGFSIGNKGYIGTGEDGAYKKDFWEYDPATNIWTQKANFGGTARTWAVGFSIGSKGYLGTGLGGGYKNDFWEYDPATNVWTQKTNFGGTARAGAVGFSIGNKGYIGTGNDGAYKNDFWEYDPVANAWTQKANFGASPRSGAVGLSIGNKGYVGMGADVSAYRNDFWEYDPATNVWTQKTNFGGTARVDAVGFSIGKKGYVGIGNESSTGNAYKNDFWEYDPSANAWTLKSNFGGTTRVDAVGFSIGNKGYLGTGLDGAFKNDFWEYDPSINVWNQKANFGGAARSKAVGFSIGSKGYLGTGEYGTTNKIDFWEYDPATNVWTQKANFGGTARNAPVVFSIGSKGYLGTGYDGANKNDFWEYDPATNLWTQKANFGGTARNSAVGFTVGSKGYVGTGFDGSNRLNDFWEYDPVTNVWIQKANFGGTGRTVAAGFSIVNKGYIGTGFDGVGNKNDFWEYDPTANLWTQKANFGGTARYGAVGFSIGSKGYVGTGYDGAYKNDFWEYDPASNVWTQKSNFGSTARNYAVGFSIGNKGYTGTGYDGSKRYGDFWEYSPTNTSITTGSVTGSYCPGSSVSVPYTIGCTAFTAGNIFTAQLSDSSGTFANPVNIGTVTATSSGTITATMPAVVDAGTKYRIRVIGSNPVTYGTDNGTDLTINAPINTSVSIASSGTTANVCSTNSLTFTATPTNGGLTPTYTWKKNGATVGTNSTTYTNASWANNDSVQCLMTSNATCPLPATTWSNKIFINLDNPTADSWQQKADFGGTSRYGAVGFSIGSKGYLGTGYDGAYKNDFWEYDPAANLWTQKANFGGTARFYAVGFSIGSKGYVGTGYDGANKNDFWEYDPATNVWTQKVNFGGTARHVAVGFSIGNKGYLGTGYDGAYKNDFWEYDPATNVWTQKVNFGGTARYIAVGFSIGNKGYLGTGLDGNFKNDFWEYDPSTNVWTQKANFGGTARYRAVGFSIGSKGYVGTGYDLTTYYNDFWEYNPATNTWAQKSNFGSTARYFAVGFSIGNKGYLGTGYYNGLRFSDFWEYSPTNTRITTGSVTGSYCPGSSVSVPFTIGCTAFTAGNIFTAQLSDSSGTFASPVNIGTVTATSSGTITATMPAVVDAGTKYRIRVIGSNPVTYGTDNGTDLTINAPIYTSVSIASSGTTANLCSTNSLTFTATPTNGGLTPTYTWKKNGATVGTNSTTYTNTSWANNDSVQCLMTSNATCPLPATTWSNKIFINLDNPIANSWQQKADVGFIQNGPSSRNGAVGFSIGNKGYMGTGIDGTTYKNDFWEYDHATNVWTQKANFGSTARNNAVGFSIGNKGYVGTGFDGAFKNDFWEYNPATNEWTQKANFGGTARYGAVGFSIGSNGYVGTGYDGSVYKNDFWEYNPTTNAWTQKANFVGTARRFAVGFSIGIKGYVGTGVDGTARKNDFWEYDPATNAWTLKANFGGTARDRAVGFSIGSKGYVGTGDDGNNRLNDFWEYDPTTNVWTQKAKFGGTARRFAVGFSIGSKGYLGTGLDGYNSNDFWEYEPATNTWIQKGATARNYAVGFSIGNKGYVGTGSNSANGTINNDFWEYNPATNAWTQKANFGGSARNGAVGFSIGSKGYLGTGLDGGTYILKNDFWEYDPATNAWTQKTDFGGTARNGAVGFSIGNKGYVGTGYDNTGAYTNDFWEFNPATNAWTQKSNFGGTGRYQAIGFSIGSKGYVGTGNDGTGTAQARKGDFWEYDPITNIWTQQANFGGTARYQAVGLSIGNKGYVGTGFDGALKNDFWEYDPSTNVWSPKTNFGGTARYYALGFSIGKKGYVGTGSYNSNSSSDFWEYSPTNTSITTGSISATICPGSSVSIPYSIGCTAFNSGNIFTAQLSDSSGMFGNPVNIGTLTATGSGTITGLIPANTLGGSKYRIRVVGSLPETYGLISENDFTILVQSISTTNVTKCSNELPYSWNGNSYSAAGTYSVTLTNSVGCDSVANLILTVKNTSSSSTLVSICPSQLPYNWNGNNYSNADTYSVTLTNSVGCDSVANLVLTVNNTSSSSTPVTICSNQLPYSWNGNSYITAGTYSVTLTNLVGCDSIATLVLIVNNTPRSSINSVTICSNQLPYSWNGTSYNSAGTYSVSLTNSVGCDSVANLLLTVNNTSSSSTPVSICSGQLPYTWNGNSYSVAGTYSVVLTNTAGCDSIATLLLSTSQSTSNTTAISACDSYYWSVSGQTYTSSGSYTSVTGCSTQILNLTINTSTSNTTTTSACGSYTWSLNGQTYTSSGTYSYISGCSTENLVLTIIPFVNNISTVSACDSYFWNVNGQTYTQSGSYTVAVSGATVSGSGGGVRISRLYPGGGGTTGTYLRDYIELYNSSCSPINISGWSLVYGSSTGNFAATSSTSFTFPVGTTIASKKYLLIECGASGTVGSSLPVTPDFSTTTSTLSMSATSGKVALLNTTISNLACASLEPSTVVDKLSWGTGNCPEGTAKTAPTTSQVLVRNNDGETDTDNNSNDFTNSSTSVVTPRNAASTANSSSPCVAACTNEVLNLTITASTSNTTSVSACESYTWTANGQTYTSSGSYTSVTGCTTHFLNLTITSRPEMPTLACYQTATFITSSCSWVVTGTQPTMPTLACYETATFNTSSCVWVVTGTQPVAPTGLACYQTSSFNTTTCAWVVTGTQPVMPTLACYQTATFNTGTCSWDVTGSQPSLPTLECYQTASFNITTCAWVVTGTQPAMPTLACYQTANFNTSTCSWDVTGTAPSVIVTTTSACNTYTWSVNSNAYTQSGTYNYNTNCQDYTLNLTIKQPTTSTTTATASGSYTWNGNIYNNSGTYTYHTTNAAGCDSTATLSLTINAIVINNITNVCNYIGTNQTLTYTASVSGASSYVWILPPNTQLVSGQGTRSIVIKLLNGFASQANKQLRVTPAGGSLQIIYLAAQAPVTPAAITASISNICGSIGTNVPITYKIPKVIESASGNATASSYLWTSQNGTNIISHPYGTGENDTIVTITFASNFTSSNVNVQALNACGLSGTRSYFISRNNPSQPSIISGPTNACEYIADNGQIATYTVSASLTVDSYTWIVPQGAIGLVGQGTNTISFKYPAGFTGGSISVVATNKCGTSQSRSLAISRLVPFTPGNIDVINIATCPNRVYTYSVAYLPSNATSLLWTVPASGIIMSGQGTRSITVSYSGTVIDGYVTAKSVSNCGSSSVRAIIVKLAPCPANPFTTYTKNLISNSKLSMYVKVFPNPTISSFKLQVIDNVSVSEINVRVLDVQGRLIKKLKINPNESITLGSDFKPGVYMLEVNIDGEKKVVRMVKY